MRVILYTGKGGTGKTSLAAATALGSAARGHRTLVVSTDNAHSLGDAFGRAVGSTPTTLRPRLDALEIDVLTEVERYWQSVHEYLLALLASQGVEQITAEEVVILPGMELIAALLLLDDLEKERRYDTVILDTAPTADTLRLLSFPSAVDWYFRHFFKVQRGLTRVVRTTVGRAMRTPLPPDRVFATLEELHNRFIRVRNLLTDSTRATVRLVVNPEKMVIAETQRAYTYLSLFGLAVEMLVVNRVLPATATSGYFAETGVEQAENLARLTELFGGLPQLPVPRYPTEVIGIPALERLAHDVFAAEDPVHRWPTEPPVRFVTRGTRPTIEMALPFAEPSEIDVAQRGDMLYVRVGAYRRSLVLPIAYARGRVESASFEAGRFMVRFRPPARARAPAPAA